MESDARYWANTLIPTPNRTGVPIVDQGYVNGGQVQTEDFTLADATATTITLPVLDSAGDVIADDGHMAWTILLVVGGTGTSQVVLVGAATGNSREYAIETMATPCNNTSRMLILGSRKVNVSHAGDTAWNSGAVTAAALAADCITAAKIATGAVTAAALAADCITAAKIATGAIDADALAADAVAEIWGTALAESYRSVGSTGTAAQLLYELIAHLGSASISGTTKTVKKVGGTPAKTYTLNSATSPTSIVETT
jgi:hypothetical protein